MARKTRKPNSRLIGLPERMRGKRNYSDVDIDAMVAAVGELPSDGAFPPGFSYGDRPRAEIAKVLWRRELAERVEAAAVMFAHEVSWQERPPPSVLSNQLNAIATAGRRLMQKLASGVVVEANGTLLRTVARQALQEKFEDWAKKQQGYPSVFPDLLPREFHVHEYRGTDYASAVALERCIRAIEMLTSVATSAEQIPRSHIQRGRRGGEARNRGDVALQQFVADLCKHYAEVFGRKASPAADGPCLRFIQAALKPIGIHKSRDAISALVKSALVKSDQKTI